MDEDPSCRSWMHPELVTETVAARALGIAPSTLRRRIALLGLVPHGRGPTTRRYWDVDALAQALSAATRSDEVRAGQTSALGCIDRHVNRHLARQIANDLRIALERGVFESGELPTTAALAQHYRVSGNTVRRALRALRADGVHFSRAGNPFGERLGTRSTIRANRFSDASRHAPFDVSADTQNA
ncbi:GntR family transcriptional regulator [Pseudonocardia broussonetiae]|uniref:GntR family transcriptional regulator n=1 Tax=Pseudonocardia broussonetiae TaxID=2736640 RepID=A0A6M6JPC9_9PSEU|nr:GntR family transcriptional regulator [Pseudonocardia broussonetiae]QJY49050.1 GntR family transcriptional regulator [Pseudonocardia broussonetiae]